MSKYFKNILKASTLIFIYLLLLILIPLDLEHGPKVLTPENMGSILALNMQKCFKDYKIYIHILNCILELAWPKQL